MVTVTEQVYPVTFYVNAGIGSMPMYLARDGANPMD